MNNSSYWEKDLFTLACDLVVVGAGIVGLSAALFFKRNNPGRSVLVLEQDLHPRGASTRNAGFACIGSVTEHEADLEQVSEELVKERIKRRYRGLQLLKETLGERVMDYDSCGGYELFLSDEAFSGAKSQVPKYNRWLSELVDEQEVYIPQWLNGYPVIRNRLEGALHPGLMIRALVEKVVKVGAEIRWGHCVEKVEEDGTLKLSDGTSLQPGHTLLATNGFTRNLLPDLNVEPARGYIFVTAPLRHLPWKGTFHHDRGYIYFRNVGNRLLVGGARHLAGEQEKTGKSGINPVIKQHLVRFTDEALKISAGWKIDYEWAGTMGFTGTKMPVVKQLGKRLSIAAGLSGMGISIGMEVGRKAAALVGGRGPATDDG